MEHALQERLEKTRGLASYFRLMPDQIGSLALPAVSAETVMGVLTGQQVYLSQENILAVEQGVRSVLGAYYRRLKDLYDEELLATVNQVIKPAMAELAEGFKARGQVLQQSQERLEGRTEDGLRLPAEVEYQLSPQQAGGSTYVIAFLGHRENVDVLLSIQCSAQPGKYAQRFQFGQLNRQEIENELMTAIEYFRIQLPLP